MQLTGYKILLGVTGGIAAYKSAYLARLFVKAGAEVQVVMTEAGTKFITPLTFEALTSREVPVKMFPGNKYVSTRHIDLAQWADLIVVAPATADFLAQVAGGFCQSLLATIVCATARPILIAPAMNEGMFANPIVQKNIKVLKELGYHFTDVGVGEMACHSYGAGRMAEPDEIYERAIEILQNDGPLSGKKVLVTAGPAREGIDPVRFISNRSSGKMGFALAIEARKLGAEVTLVTGPVNLDDPQGIKTVRVESTSEMAEAVQKEFPESDILIMASAPADFTPANYNSTKIKKSTDKTSLVLKPTIDILASISKTRRDNQVVVGFSLETENEIDNSKKKLISKNLDFIVVNNALEEGAGFDCDTNRVTVISRDGSQFKIEKISKELVSRQLWDYILTHGRF